MGKFVKWLIVALMRESQHLGLVNNVRRLLVIHLFYPSYAMRIDTLGRSYRRFAFALTFELLKLAT